MKVITGVFLAGVSLVAALAFPVAQAEQIFRYQEGLQKTSPPAVQRGPHLPFTLACSVTGINYAAYLGTNTWVGALDHKPAMWEAVYAVPEVYFSGEITSVPSLDGTFFIMGKNLDCAKESPQVFIKGTVPGHSDQASEPWTTVTATPAGSSSDKCTYSYSIPTAAIKGLFVEASKKYPDSTTPFGIMHDFAVVMKPSNVCSGYDNRFYIEVYESSTKPTGAPDPIRSWNADFGEP